MPEIAVVVPVFDNRATLPEMGRQLSLALDDLHTDWQVIWVDDASSDGSWAWIRSQCERTSNHRGVRLERNRGQSLAVCVGMAHAPAGAVVVTIDADLEYSAADIGGMVSAVTGPRVFVAGIRPRTEERSWSSDLFNAVTRLLTGDRVGDVGCGFMAIGPELAAEVGRTAVRALALRPYLSSRASSTIRREVRHEPAGTSTTGHRLRARIAIDVLAADPRPARRLGIAAVTALTLGSLTSRSRTVGVAGALTVVAAVGLAARGAVLRHRLVTDPPRVAEFTGPGRQDARHTDHGVSRRAAGGWR